MFSELNKLRVYANGLTVNADMVKELVVNNAANSLQLAAAIRIGKVGKTLELIENLINCNEPALRIVSTLVTTFRTWLIVKLMIAAGEKDDSAIAYLADIKNPKRLYFLRLDVANVPVSRLQNAMAVLLELELMLKNSGDEKSALETQIIKLCTQSH